MVKGYLHSAIILIVLIALSCHGDRAKNLLPELYQCDSAVVMYYITPGNPRFYKMSKLYDSSALSSIANNANRFYREQKDTCLSRGKIFYYGDQGEVYVLYFSTNENCRFLRFIKTGEIFEVPLLNSVSKILDSLQLEAYAPVPSKTNK